jgi:Nuclease-related domain
LGFNRASARRRGRSESGWQNPSQGGAEMLIKSTDDKSKRLKLLEDLQKSNALDVFQREWLAKQLRNQRIGMAGERDAAHYIDNHYRDRSTHAVIHDLRIKVDDDVAQIDHLVISRGMHFYLLETKSFNGDLFINEHGEFSVKYAGDSVYGIPSPLEQSRRHANVLAKLLEQLEIGSRVRSVPHFHHLVLVHPKAKIDRPEWRPAHRLRPRPSRSDRPKTRVAVLCRRQWLRRRKPSRRSV